MKLRAGLVLLVGILIAADDEATKKDMEKIQGTWDAVAGEKSGTPAPANALANIHFTFAGNKLTIAEGSGKVPGTFRLDASKKPKTIDLTMKDGAKEEPPLLGIYSLEGDELTICVMKGGKDRPKELKTKAGSGTQMLTFKRAKKR